MLVFANAGHNATRTTAFRYALTGHTQLIDIPENIDEVAVIIRDASGNFIECTGKRVAAEFTIQEFLDSSSGMTIPNLSGDLLLYSATGKVGGLRRDGVAATVSCGQSNGSNWGTGTVIATKDRDDPRILQWVDASGNAHFSGGVEPGMHAAPGASRLYHSDYGLNSNGPSWQQHYAYQKLQRGYGHVCILPQCHGGAGFSNGTDRWEVGGTYLVRTEKAMISFILADPDRHFIDEIVWNIGEGDASVGLSGAAFKAHMVAAVNALKTNVGAATGHDLNRVPVLVIGMNQDQLDTGGANYQTIETAQSQLPGEEDFYGHLPLPNSTSSDNVHHDFATHRNIGEELPAVRLAAVSNYTEPGFLSLNATAPNVPITGNSAQLVTTAPDPLILNATAPNLALAGNSAQLVTTAPDPLILNATAPNVPIAGTTAELVTAPALPYPNVAAASGSLIFHAKDDDVYVDNGNQFTGWKDALNGHDAGDFGASTSNITYTPPGGVVFNGPASGSTKRMIMNAAFTGIAAAGSGTFIIDFQGTSGYLALASNWQINLNTGDVYFMFPSGEKFVDSSGNLSDGVRKHLKITIDSSGVDIYADDTLLHTASSPTLTDPGSTVSIGGSGFGGMLNGTVYNIYAAVGGGRKSNTAMNTIITDFVA